MIRRRGVVIVARYNANRFLDGGREKKKEKKVDTMVEGGEGDGRRIENRNAIILSTALFTGEKRTIADPAAPIFIVVNLAARMCWSRAVSR